MTARPTAPALLTDAIDALASGCDLSLDRTAAVLSEIMAGNASEIQIAAFLIALRTKGETVDELAGPAPTLPSPAAHLKGSSDQLPDTAGTGGGRRTVYGPPHAPLISARARGGAAQPS